MGSTEDKVHSLRCVITWVQRSHTFARTEDGSLNLREGRSWFAMHVSPVLRASFTGDLPHSRRLEPVTSSHEAFHEASSCSARLACSTEHGNRRPCAEAGLEPRPEHRMEHSTSLVLGEGEEALLALERAHGSSSAQQWSVLCEVLAEIRRQVGEALVAVADGQRRAAVADEHFLRERSKRESADAALRADLRCLGEQFRGEVSRCASDARDALNSCVADLDARLCKLQDFESEVQARNEALRQEFRVECGVSRSSHDQLLQALSEMRQAARVEAEAHAVAVSQTQEEVRKVEELLTTTTRQHEERVDQIHSKFESLIQEERNRRERDASRQQDNVEVRVSISTSLRNLCCVVLCRSSVCLAFPLLTYVLIQPTLSQLIENMKL